MSNHQFLLRLGMRDTSQRTDAMECTEQSWRRHERDDGMETAAYEDGRDSGPLTAERSDSTPSTAKRFRSTPFMSPTRRGAGDVSFDHLIRRWAHARRT